MKIKLQLDKAAVQTFLIENVEKIVLGLAVLVFCWMVYSAVGVPRYGKTTDQLNAAVGRAEQNLSQTPKDATPEGQPPVKVQAYDKLAEQSRQPVSASSYVQPNVWDREPFPKRELRPQPPMYGVEELRGTAEVGAFQMAAEGTPVAPDAAGGMPGGPGAMMPAAGAGGVRGQRWVVLTGLVPKEKQDQAFSTLKDTVVYDATSDTPKYAGYKVERLEVTSPAEAANPDWSKAVSFISGAAVSAARTKWGGQERSDVVAPTYLDPKLVFPLGPMTNRDWGESVAHLPQIPLQTADGAPLQPVNPTLTPNAAPKLDPFGNPIETTPLQPTPGREDVPKTFPYLLFRFFDFDAKPGKRYVYRVQVALYNPNFGLKPSMLKDPAQAKVQYAWTNWSSATPVIFVPHDTRILAGSVTSRRGDSIASVLMVKWLQEQGTEVSEKRDMIRGQTANFPAKKTVPRPAPKAKGSAKGAGKGAAKGELMPPMPEMVAPVEPEAVPVDYISNSIAVDFRGGEAIRGRRGGLLGKLYAPGGILMLDADGNLVLHDELEDKAEYIKLTARAEGMLPKEGIMPGGPMPGGLDMIMPDPRRGVAPN